MTTTNLTPSQIALDKFIADENAKFVAQCIAEGSTFWATFALTAADLAKYGVFNIAQFKEWRYNVEQQESEKEDRKNAFNRW
jgi:hypothetical protein